MSDDLSFLDEVELFWYDAEYLGNYDGDTITLLISQGLYSYQKEKCRLSGLDCPEIRGVERPDGLVSKDYVFNVLSNAHRLRIRTLKDKKGKYGRFIAKVYYKSNEEGSWRYLNRDLIIEGFAEEKHY